MAPTTKTKPNADAPSDESDRFFRNNSTDNDNDDIERYLQEMNGQSTTW